MTRLCIIRHAKPATVWGGGDDDPGLDSQGEAQARMVARELMDQPPALRPSKVASSPLRRCLETARPLAQSLGVEIEIVDEIGELPTPAALDRSVRGAWLRSAFQGRWSDIQGDLDYDAWRRTVFAAVRARPDTALFSHFVAINGVVSLLQGRDEVITFRPDHTSVTDLDSSPEGLRLLNLGREAPTGVL